MTNDIDNKTQKKTRDISIVTGVFVENEDNEVLFVKMPKWGDRWGIPGGHLDRGEALEKAALRELKEETGVDADKAEYIGYTEMAEPKDFHKSKHFISFQFKVKVKGRPKLKLEKRELTDHRWMTLEDARKQDDLNSIMVKTLEMMSDQVKEENIDYKDKWLRAQADYSNLQKEISEKRSQWAEMSEWQILEEFIPVYDNFKKAFDNDQRAMINDQKLQNWVIGVEYIKKQFSDVLASHGVEEIETIGETFDPNFHECMSEESSDEHEDGAIIREVSSGYKKGGRVLKVAGVVLNKKNKE